MLGNAQSDLSGKTAAGGAELMRSGREIAEQNLRAINEKRRAEINAQQAQMMNAALNVASMGAGLMAGPAAGAATNALTQAAVPQQAPLVSHAPPIHQGGMYGPLIPGGQMSMPATRDFVTTLPATGQSVDFS